MSSLSISVLILALAAIVAVAAVNLVQAFGWRKRLSQRRSRLRAADPETPAADPIETPVAAPPTAGGFSRQASSPPRAVRREPRLGEVAADSTSAEGGHTVPSEDHAGGSARPAVASAATAQPWNDNVMAEPVAGDDVSRSSAIDTDTDTDTDTDRYVDRYTDRTRGEGANGFIGTEGAEGTDSTDGADRTGEKLRAAAQAPAPGARSQAQESSPRADASRFDARAPVREADCAVLSPLCDCIVTLPLDRPVPGERLLALTQGIRRAGAKPILADGIPAGLPVAQSGHSEPEARSLATGMAYRALRMGVLLANRHGPLNAMEFSDFVSAVQSVADQLSSLADPPDMADAIARARDLDATCAQLDAQIGLNVDSPEPLGAAQVGALAADLGLVDRGGHRHVRLGSNGELVFTMSLTGSPQRLGFLLDVPRSSEVLGGFAAMTGCAQDAAVRLSGQVTDDSGRAISEEALGTIARQLRQRYESLDAIGLAAGSPLAMRVFS